MIRARLIAAAVVAVLVMGGAGACSDSDTTEGVAGDRIEALSGDLLPESVLGLDISQEDITDALAGAERSYVDGSALYAFRTAELLQATLQVSRFSDEARPESSDFRNALLGQVGGSRPQQVRVGESNVYLTQGNRQRIAVWFTGDYFFILSTREDFDRPRTLLREVLEVAPS